MWRTKESSEYIKVEVQAWGSREGNGATVRVKNGPREDGDGKGSSSLFDIYNLFLEGSIPLDSAPQT